MMKRFLVVRDYSEYEQAMKDSNGIEVIAVVSGERERKSLADVIRESKEGEEIEIDSIVNAFSSVIEIKEILDLAIERGVDIRTMDGSFSTEDMEDVPALGYLLNSIVELGGNVRNNKETYPPRFLEVITEYLDRGITEVDACKILNIQRAQFYRLLKKFGIRRSRGRE